MEDCMYIVERVQACGKREREGLLLCLEPSKMRGLLRFWAGSASAFVLSISINKAPGQITGGDLWYLSNCTV